MKRDPKTQREQIRQEAAAWVVRLAEPHGAAERERFAAWQAQGAGHEVAFQRELSAWTRLDRLRSLHAAVPEPVADSSEPLPPVRRHGGRWRAIAASLLVAAGAGGLLAVSLNGDPAYATAVGERRTVRLDDGSRVELNTDSKIVVRYGRGRRLVELVQGEALFHVRTGARPFMVHTRAVQLDTGTADVAVRLVDNGARIMVRDGTVLASMPASGSSRAVPATTIAAGSEAVVEHATADVHAVTPAQVAQWLAWRRGGIALDGMTLAQAAAEFNRYNLRKVSIGDPATGRLRVGGFFQSSDVGGFVTALTRAFSLQARVRPDGDIVLGKAV